MNIDQWPFQGDASGLPRAGAREPQRSMTDSGCRIAAIYSRSLGSARVTLDVGTGAGYEHDLRRGVFRLLTPAESRLMLLSWTRDRMPVPSPPALWILEAAALTTGGSDRRWRGWASAGLHSALGALVTSPIEWSSGGRTALAEALECAAVDPIRVDADALTAIIAEVEATVAARWRSGSESEPAPESVSGCSEIEWDRVRSAGTDLGELGVRSRIHGTAWTASIRRHRLHLSREPARLWARLVDDVSGVIYGAVEMECSGGLWSARGYVPQLARTTATRIDVSTDPAVPARTRDERADLLIEQAWFRALHFERRRSADPAWTEWSRSAWERLGIESSGWQRCELRPFLAERHLQPTDLASGIGIPRCHLTRPAERRQDHDPIVES